MGSDLIDRQAAIDALDGNVIVTSKESAQAVMDYIRGCADRMRSLPSAQPDLDSAYTEGYTYAESKYRKIFENIVQCKNCIHWSERHTACNRIGKIEYGAYDFCSKGERRTDE